MFRHCLIAALLGVVPLTLAAQDWIPIVAHTPGSEDSVWRTDVTILNTCPDDVEVELVLHTDTGEVSQIFEIAGGQQQLFEDVVAQLVDGDLSAALEIRSEVELSTSSRTYNVADSGTFGQGLASVDADDGLAMGASVSLQQLRQDESFRTNIGVLNMGSGPATVAIFLFDGLGSAVGDFSLEVEPGTTIQDSRPYSLRFDRDDITAGYAIVTVDVGSHVFTYASVVDGRTGDPTTMTPEPLVECPMDIADRLAAIDGLTVTENATARQGYRYFQLFFDQPIDHDDPDGASFSQYMTLLHKAESAPMIYETLGYSNGLRDRATELTTLLEANQLGVEHRFFGQSDPGVDEIEHLTIEQAAADHHRIAAAMQAIYDGAWVSSGASKGGMTATFHRRFYPDDVDATVPYVAPISFGAPDDRYVTFLENVGTESCRNDIAAFQRQILIRRQAMISRINSFSAQYALTYDRIGGTDVALESAAMEIPFTFWQYSGESYCNLIPPPSATDDQHFDFFIDVVPVWWAADQLLGQFGSYFYQAQHQLGFPDLSTANVADLLETEWVSLEEGLINEGAAPPTWDPAPMLDIAAWVADQGSELLFIYGENDTWTAGAFELGNATDSATYVAPGGTHGSGISDLVEADREAVYQTLERWTGVAPAKTTSPTADRAPRGRSWQLELPGMEQR